MSRYDKFGDYLDSQNESFSITFKKVEEIIGEKLPDSAYHYSAWWSNNDSHPLMDIVLSKNWKSQGPNLEKQEIEFLKINKSEMFQFVAKDFESATKNKEDSQYLHTRFKILRDEIKNNLSGNFSISKNYVGHPYSRGYNDWKDYQWLGFWRTGTREEAVQFQVSINNENNLSVFNWITGKSIKTKEHMLNKITTRSEEFLNLIKKLPNNFKIGLKLEKEKVIENNFSEVNKEFIDKIKEILPKKTAEFYIARRFSKIEAIEYETRIIGEICNTFEKLIPISEFLGIKNQEISESPLLKFVKGKWAIFANYQPILIKTLLEKGNENNFSVSIKEIEEKIIQLNFDREDFKIKNAMDAVLPALEEFVEIDGEKILLKSNVFFPDEIPECLKICGQKIMQWHIEHILNDKKLDIWRVLPGTTESNLEFEKGFSELNSIGVGYGMDNLDLTNLTIDEVKKECDRIFMIKYPQKQQAPPGMKASVTAITHKITAKDIIVLTRGEKEVIDFGIVISKYFFNKKSESGWNQRRNVVWFNQGPISKTLLPFISKGPSSAIWKFSDESKEKILEYILEPKNYFIITSYPDSKYRDKPGKEYEFPSHIKNAKLFVNGTNFIVQTKINDQNHFVGYGKVQEIIKKQVTNDKGKSITMCTANYSQYREFDTPKIRTSEIKDKMQWIAFPNTGNGSPPPAMLEIPHSFYREIIGEDLTSKEDELDTVSMDNYDRALDWKPNLILYGPPGTGKTYHANEIAKRITNNQISKIGICWPTDKDEDKIESFQNVIEDHEKVLWGVNWSIDQVKKSDFPIKGYIYYKQNIIAIATISNCTLHEETNDADLKLRPEKWHNGQDYKNYLHFTSVNRCVPFSHKKLKLNDSTKIIPDIIQQRVYVKQKTNFIRKVTFHPSYSYEDFIEGYRPNVKGTDKNPYKLENGIFKQICNDAKDDDPKTQYVIIIDEINRGNIPKILGELITLIEKDKRNSENSLKLTYSKDDFFVPENLIIIGTMNTADKSLMQMDDALKRRFVFEELMPDTKLLEEELTKNKISNSKDYSKILKRINEKITGDGKNDEAMIQFRDRQIGHSYFWKLQNDDDLQKVIKYDIIPLLQDYFYGDYSKIREILGNKKDDEFTIIGKDNRTTDLVNDISQSHELRKKLLEILE
jgi:DNA polymerase III delta prime subunit